MEIIPAQSPETITVRILLELGIPAHRAGYSQLCIAIPHFSEYKNANLSDGLYFYVSNTLHCTGWRAVERAIRHVITDAWKRRDPEVWAQYFPFCKRPPSNKRFIATLAEYIR